ncbi:DedA family protein [bacterium]|nr:DedA family protein [bacterium]
MEHINELIAWVKSLHQVDTIVHWLSVGGLYLVTGVIFAETGLLAGFFLPGDSLIITTGVLTNPLNPNHLPGLSVYSCAIAMTFAAILGDQVGYFLGRKAGEMVFDRKDGVIFKRDHLIRAKAFYDQYGVAAILACRFIPIFRTFVPFVAGVAGMKYRKYLAWDVLGGMVWINSLLTVGYFLGQTVYADRLDKIIVIVVFVSILPIIIGAVKKSLQPGRA